MMNKTNTTESTLNMIKSLCAERDRRERNRLISNRIEVDRREEAERERIQSTNSILNSYIEKAKARENQHSQERNQSIQNLHDENERRREDNDLRARDISSAISRGIQKVKENESRNTADAFIDRNKRLLDKGRDAVKREQNKIYFS